MSVKETLQKFRDFKNSNRETFLQEFVEDRDFVANKQFESEDAYSLEAENQRIVTHNEITPAINQVISQLTSNNPRFSVTASEDSDSSTATAIADLMAHIWQNSKGKVKVKRSIKDYEIGGMGALMAYIDPYADFGKGEIMICDVDPVDLYIDPNSTEEDSSDASDIMIAPIKTEAMIKSTYPSFSFKDAVEEVDDSPVSTRYAAENQETGKITDSTVRKYRVIDRYTKIKADRFHVIDPQLKLEKILTREEYEEFAQEMAFIATQGEQERYITDPVKIREYEEFFNQFYAGDEKAVFHLVRDNAGSIMEVPGAEIGASNEIQGSTTLISRVTFGQLLNEGHLEWRKTKIDRIRREIVIGEKPFYDEVLPISRYPIVTFKLHSSRNPYPHGDVRLVKPMQEQLNDINSVIMKYNRALANLKIFLPEGFKNIPENKNLEERIAKDSIFIGGYNAEDGVPVFAQMQAMSNSLYEDKDRLTQQIQRIIGAYAFQDGQVSSAPNTFRGTMAIDEMGQRRARAKQDDIEFGLTQLGKVVLEMIPYVYTERKVIRLLKANNETRNTVINEKIKDGNYLRIANDVTIGNYDVQVIAGSMLANNRMAEAEMLIQLWDKGVVQNRATILRKFDIDDIEGEIQSGDIVAQAQQQMAAMEEEIKKLKGDLQTRDREAVNLRKKVEVEKFKGDLGGMSQEVKANAKVAQMRLSDKVKENKEEKK